MKWLWLVCFSAGCAVSVRGAIVPSGDNVVVRELSGEQTPLRLRGSARVLRFLDGELIELSGTQSWGQLRVQEWRLIEGVSGIPAYIGIVERYGRQLVLREYNSGARVLLEPDVTQELLSFIGKPVMVEGYIDEHNQLAVVHYQILVDGEE
jgi:hypothetical protein